jgi:hypothetical protein
MFGLKMSAIDYIIVLVLFISLFIPDPIDLVTFGLGEVGGLGIYFLYLIIKTKFNSQKK